MKINANDYDFIITSQKGCVRVYENGKEIYGIQELSYCAKCGEFSQLEIKQTIADKDGNFYLVGGGKTEKRERENV